MTTRQVAQAALLPGTPPGDTALQCAVASSLCSPHGCPAWPIEVGRFGVANTKGNLGRIHWHRLCFPPDEEHCTACKQFEGLGSGAPAITPARELGNIATPLDTSLAWQLFVLNYMYLQSKAQVEKASPSDVSSSQGMSLLSWHHSLIR